MSTPVTAAEERDRLVDLTLTALGMVEEHLEDLDLAGFPTVEASRLRDELAGEVKALQDGEPSVNWGAFT